MKKEIDSPIVKKYGKDAGADVVGIASSNEFTSAPEGFRPSDVMKECASVIVLGISFSRDAFESSSRYTQVRAAVIEKTKAIEKEMVKRIKADGYKATGISSTGGRFIDGIGHGAISLKHAAELAGIGIIGRNYLLINPQYGTLLWFTAVITDAELVPDERMRFDICDNCNKCVEICPTGALKDITKFGKKGCAKRSFKMVNKKWEMDCFLCRSVCPYCFGK